MTLEFALQVTRVESNRDDVVGSVFTCHGIAYKDVPELALAVEHIPAKFLARWAVSEGSEVDLSALGGRRSSVNDAGLAIRG
jgi:hypothetical protein